MKFLIQNKGILVGRILIQLSFLVFAIGLKYNIDGDGEVRRQVLVNFFENKGLQGKYSIIMPFFAAPLYFIDNVLGLNSNLLERFNFLLFFIFIAALYFSLRKKISEKILINFLLILISGSMFAHHLRNFYGEVFTTVGISFGLILTIFFNNKYTKPLGILSMILAAANTPASILGLFLLNLKKVWESKRLRYILITLIVAGLIFLEIKLKGDNGSYNDDRGVKTIMPYSGLSNFSYPFFFGLMAIVFSFGKGLLFYTPGLFLKPSKELKKEKSFYNFYKSLLVFTIGLVILYSSWWAWYGGWYWGPRFFLIASVPASLLLAFYLYYLPEKFVTKLGLLIILILSVWVGLNGAVFGQGNLDKICVENNFTLESLCHYSPEFSSLWHPFVIGVDAFSNMGKKNLILTFYFVTTFIYLAYPLLKSLSETVYRYIKNTKFNVKEYKF